ncbi:MAG: alanine--glyoxylate aminotransferase family protein [Planctomycetota bacterium]|nr:MAG: alanine--glyoxylate aminotransferase family protein [Planctomycetota bacterium]
MPQVQERIPGRIEDPLSTLPPSLNPPARILMGPGPSDVAPSVLRAMAKPTLGHLDPRFLEVMDQIRDMLQVVFGTRNELTMPMSGTGSAGMETMIVNLVEPGDRVLVGVNGVFGTRMADVARRAGAEVVEVKTEWGKTFTPEAFREAAAGQPCKLLCVVHAETSTGAHQAIPPLKEVAEELGALLCLDCVTSLGGVPVELDAWGVDAAYSGTQKCLSCPPGLAPVSFSARAADFMAKRRHPVQSWYLDLGMIRNYWGGERAYHHTAPINMLYALHEALRLALEEGLEARFLRHRRLSEALVAGLRAMGLSIRVPDEERLPQLTPVAIPEGINDAQGRRFMLEQFGLEIGGGLGPMAGNTWRIGLMGAACSRRNVHLCLSAVGAALGAQGYSIAGDPLQAAADALNG